MFSDDDDDDDEGYNSDGSRVSAGHARTKTLQMVLHAHSSSCRVVFYSCPYSCALRFPALGFHSMTVRKHLRDHHLDFVPYRSSAVPSLRSRVEDHAHYPDLYGSSMTDALLERHKAAARRLMYEDLTAPHGLQFPYVDVSLLGSSEDKLKRHVYACVYCTFSSSSLEIYKHHVIVRHVRMELLSLPAKESVFPVLGSPVR